MFWHNIWVENGRPRNGIVADLRRKRRAQYHRACRMVFRKEAEIRGDKMADTILNKSGSDMWKQARGFRKKQTFYPSKVDDVMVKVI